MISVFAIGLVLIGTLLGSVGTLLFKKGADRFNFKDLLQSTLFWVGLMFYGLSVLLYVVALRMGELSVVYPFVSTSYIWTMLFSVKILGEKMNKWKWISLVGIIIGVVLVGVGS